MKRVSAHDVAAEIRSRLSNPGVVKVHKLLYYCQAWHVVSTGEPLFTEDIQAWANGPVVADFWHDEDKHRNPPPARSLDSEGLATIAYVITRYGHLSGADLIRLAATAARRSARVTAPGSIEPLAGRDRRNTPVTTAKSRPDDSIESTSPHLTLP